MTASGISPSRSMASASTSVSRKAREVPQEGVALVLVLESLFGKGKDRIEAGGPRKREAPKLSVGPASTRAASASSRAARSAGDIFEVSIAEGLVAEEFSDPEPTAAELAAGRGGADFGEVGEDFMSGISSWRVRGWNRFGSEVRSGRRSHR
jgi:hypothetical protein